MDLLISANTVPQAQADTAPASGTPGWATDGNPATGQMATDAPAWHYNMMMSELLGIVDAGGLQRSNSDWAQVLRALRIIFSPAQYGVAPYSADLANLIGGYPKFSVVTDDGGTFWVSDANANTTVPGAKGASWKSLFDGYATEDWAQGLFATLTQLADEIARAKEAEATKANLDGGNTFAGQQVFVGNVVTAGTAHFEAYDQNGGQASAVFGSYDPGTGNENVEAYVNIINSTRTQVQQFTFNGSGGIASSSLGSVAFASQLPQTGFVTGGIYSIVKGGTSGGSVMSLSFAATITTRNQFVPFPMAFSSAPIINVNNGGGASSQGGVQIRAYGATALGVYIDIADTLGGVHITARGAV